MNPQFSISGELPHDMETPAVVVDLRLMDANISRMAVALGSRGIGLRPHTKTHKSVEIARRQLAAGATGLTTATVTEAEVFAAAGFDDLFVAYPVWVATPAKVARLRDLGDRVRRLRVGIDSVEGAQHLATAAAGLDTVEVVVEVDAGDDRTGVRCATDAVQVARAGADGGLSVVGVFTHGGHSYAARDAAVTAAEDEVRVLTEVGEALVSEGFDVSVRSAGSTPTALASAREGVTEERPGTYVFGDRQQAVLGSLEPSSVALVVAATVVSRSSSHVVIDAGAKVLSKDKSPLVDGYGALVGYPEATISRLYDHHGVVDIAAGPVPRLGEVVAVVPNHVCPVVNLVHEVVVIDDGECRGRWPVDAQGRNQ